MARKLFKKTRDDSLEIKKISHLFKFEGTSDKELKERIIETINQMGDFGDNAEGVYQESLKRLQTDAEKVVSIIGEEYETLPESQYNNRWSLIQLLAELKHPTSLSILDKILSNPIPPEKSKTPQYFSTRGEEIIIRTTAIEAIVRIAAKRKSEVADLLLKHMQHKNFSVKRAAIQGYLSLGIENARKILLDKLHKNDHYILEIQRMDVNKIPQAHGEKAVIKREKVDLPRIQPPKPPHKSKKNSNNSK